MISFWTVAVCTFIAGTAWLLFAHEFRFVGLASLAWMALPFAAQTVLYVWFAIGDVPIETRALWGRPSIAFHATIQALVLMLIIYLRRRAHAKR